MINGVDWLALIVPVLFRARLAPVPMLPEPSIVDLLSSVKLD
jgi:hypothetical protein